MKYIKKLDLLSFMYIMMKKFNVLRLKYIKKVDLLSLKSMQEENKEALPFLCTLDINNHCQYGSEPLMITFNWPSYLTRTI